MFAIKIGGLYVNFWPLIKANIIHQYLRRLNKIFYRQELSRVRISR